MYKEHFGLKEMPFSIAPDPRFLYMSEKYKEALAHLMYGINSDGGFVLLTGEVGTGKTTVCRCLLEQVPENIDVAFILNPKVTDQELLASICDELSIYYPEGTTGAKVFIDKINEYLLDAYSKGRKTVLIIEEAQNLSPAVLEQVRLLTNLETNQSKLLQVIMIGQPELKDILSRPELRQLSQRITARYHLGPLSKEEVTEYVNHRLAIAGATRKIFPDSVTGKLYHLSRGIPRLINIVCDRALLGAYVQGKDYVDKFTLETAVNEISGEPDTRKKQGEKLKLAVAVFLIIIAGALLTMTLYNYRSQLFVSKKQPLPLAAVNNSEAQKIDTLQQLEEGTIAQSEKMAFEALLNQWGIEYQEKGDTIDICKLAENEGLSCLNKMISFNKLIGLNRPVVLKLSDDIGKEFYGALTSIRGQTAILKIGGENKMVDLKEIERRWLGDYVLLWKPPQKFKWNIYPGYRGDPVKWLSEKLSLIQGQPYQQRKDLKYDDELVEQVKKFQLDNGMEPDGIVGPQTIIYINNSVKTDEPVLIGKKGV
jgi:general secretion pathway protein A